LNNSELKIYDLLGREVKTLLNQELLPGRYDVQWDGTNNAGAAVSSGVYIYRLQTGNVVLSRKMLLLR
jgi:flagellar hook assembly protein FlgD